MARLDISHFWSHLKQVELPGSSCQDRQGKSLQEYGFFSTLHGIIFQTRIMISGGGGVGDELTMVSGEHQIQGGEVGGGHGGHGCVPGHSQGGIAVYNWFLQGSQCTSPT